MLPCTLFMWPKALQYVLGDCQNLQVGHACVIEQLGEVQARQGWQDADGNFYWPKGFRSRRNFPSMKQEGKCSYNCEVLPLSLLLFFPLFLPSHSREGMATERCRFHHSLAL